MENKTIPDSAEPRLESFYPPFVAGIDLPHQGVVDSYNLKCISNGDTAVFLYAIDFSCPLWYRNNSMSTIALGNKKWPGGNMISITRLPKGQFLITTFLNIFPYFLLDTWKG